MEHNYYEQHSTPDEDQPIEQSQNIEDLNAHRTFRPALLSRLGLGNIFLSPEADESELKAALSSPLWSIRIEAVQVLGNMGEQSPPGLLVSTLDDENGFVRAAAVRALGKLAKQTPLEPLINALHDTEWRVRAAAANALGVLGARVPVEPLVTALTDEDESVRAAAASSFGALEEQAPIEPLVNALHDSAWNVREAAALALGKLGKRAPVEELLAALSDADKSVREAVQIALEQTHSEAFSLFASSISDPLIEKGLTSMFDNTVRHHSTEIEQFGLNGHRNTVPESGQEADSSSKIYFDSPLGTLENAPGQNNWSNSNLHQDMDNTEIPHADALSRRAPHVLRPYVLHEFYAALVFLLFGKRKRITVFLKIASHTLSSDQEKEAEDFMVEIPVEPPQQPVHRRFWQAAQMSLAGLVVISIIFASLVLFHKTYTPSVGGGGKPAIPDGPYAADSRLSPDHCPITAQGWLCTETLTGPLNTTVSFNWSATSSSKEVIFNPSGGRLSPGQSIQVGILIPDIDCKNDVFSFIGPKDIAKVTWTCVSGPSPKQLSPANGSVFHNYPRTTTLRWTAVFGAISYTVQIYMYEPGNTNCTGGTPDGTIAGITETSYTFDFVGTQPGCWRIWAVDKQGHLVGSKSPLWEFSYTV